jgi:hypothetical protein
MLGRLWPQVDPDPKGKNHSVRYRQSHPSWPAGALFLEGGAHFIFVDRIISRLASRVGESVRSRTFMTFLKSECSNLPTEQVDGSQDRGLPDPRNLKKLTFLVSELLHSSANFLV